MSIAAIYRADKLDDTQFKSRDLLELIIAYTLILLTVWTAGAIQRILLITSTTWIVVTTLLLRHKEKLYGFRLSGLRRSWWIIAAAAAMAAGAVGISARIGTLHLPFSFEQHPWRVWAYVFWSFVQQFILQDYFLLRQRRLVRNPFIAVAAVALLFSLAHLPNPLLTVATLIWGITACTLFLRYRDLYSLGLAHAILGLCIALTVPNAIHHQMRVGLGYLMYQSDVRENSAEPENPNRIDAPVGNR